MENLNQQIINNFFMPNSLVKGKILEILKKNGGYLHRNDIIKVLGRDEVGDYTPRTTVYDNLVKLINEGLVEKEEKLNGKRGRPKVYFRYIGGNEDASD